MYKDKIIVIYKVYKLNFCGRQLKYSGSVWRYCDQSSSACTNTSHRLHVRIQVAYPKVVNIPGLPLRPTFTANTAPSTGGSLHMKLVQTSHKRYLCSPGLKHGTDVQLVIQQHD